MRRRATLVALGLGALCALFVSLELLARLTLDDATSRARELDFTRRSLAFLAPCEAAPEGPRDPSSKRIAVVGESSAHLLGVALRDVVDAHPCGRHDVVLACGQPGSGLEHLARRFDASLRARPDAVVVVFGHNLQFRFDTDATRLRLRALRLRSAALTWLGSRLDPAPMGRPSPAARVAEYERFLRHAAAASRRAHAKLVVLTPAANLWMPPDGDLRGAQTPTLAEALVREATDGPRAAADAIAPTSDRADERFTRGVMLARAGDADGARDALRAAMDRDGYALRAPTAVAEMVRRVGAEAGFTVRDTQRALEADAPLGLPGWESFWDNCHLTGARFQDEAFAVLDAVHDLPPGGSRCDARPAVQDRGFADHYAAMARFARDGGDGGVSPWITAMALSLAVRVSLDGAPVAAWARDFAAQELSGPGITEARARLAVAEGLWRAGRRDEAESINASARSLTGAGGAAAWVQRGMFLLRRGDRDGARGAFERSATLDAREGARWLAERLSR